MLFSFINLLGITKMTRRMFSDEITKTDAFMDMPKGSQLLYFHLGMQADDDGFVGNPKMVMRTIGASEDEMTMLYVKKFLLQFDSGVCVIKHWRMNNYLRKDVYKETKYLREKELLFIKENGSYSFNEEGALKLPRGHFTVENILVKQEEKVTCTERRRVVHLGKISIDKVSIDKNTDTIAKKFAKPSLEEIKTYCTQRSNGVNPDKFFNYYESNGWKVGKNSMKDWQAAIRTWEKNELATTIRQPKVYGEN